MESNEWAALYRAASEANRAIAQFDASGGLSKLAAQHNQISALGLAAQRHKEDLADATRSIGRHLASDGLSGSSVYSYAVGISEAMKLIANRHEENLTQMTKAMRPVMDSILSTPVSSPEPVYDYTLVSSKRMREMEAENRMSDLEQENAQLRKEVRYLSAGQHFYGERITNVEDRMTHTENFLREGE